MRRSLIGRPSYQRAHCRARTRVAQGWKLVWGALTDMPVPVSAPVLGEVRIQLFLPETGIAAGAQLRWQAALGSAAPVAYGAVRLLAFPAGGGPPREYRRTTCAELQPSEFALRTVCGARGVVTELVLLDPVLRERDDYLVLLSLPSRA